MCKRVNVKKLLFFQMKMLKFVVCWAYFSMHFDMIFAFALHVHFWTRFLSIFDQILVPFWILLGRFLVPKTDIENEYKKMILKSGRWRLWVARTPPRGGVPDPGLSSFFKGKALFSSPEPKNKASAWAESLSFQLWAQKWAVCLNLKGGFIQTGGGHL